MTELEGRIQKLESENEQLRKENAAFKKGDATDTDPNGLNLMLGNLLSGDEEKESESSLLIIFFRNEANFRAIR